MASSNADAQAVVDRVIARHWFDEVKHVYHYCVEMLPSGVREFHPQWYQYLNKSHNFATTGLLGGGRVWMFQSRADLDKFTREVPHQHLGEMFYV